MRRRSTEFVAQAGSLLFRRLAVGSASIFRWDSNRIHAAG